MDIVIIMLLAQGLLGAFDTLYHHEFTERLAWRYNADKELAIHGIRNIFYAILFLSLGWLEWHGLWAIALLSILMLEIILTLWDFVIEDQTRLLPASERITHTILAINYGAIIAVFIPFWNAWLAQPTGFEFVQYGIFSWLMTLFGSGVLIWAFFDSSRAYVSRQITIKNAKKKLPGCQLKNQRILITGGTGFLGKPLTQILLSDGHKITLLTRNKSHAVNNLKGNINLIENLDQLTENDVFDVVINLAGEPISDARWTSKKQQLIRDSRIKTTEQLCRVILRSQQLPHTFISGSAIGFYGASETIIFDESSTPAANNFSQTLCHDWEQATHLLESTKIRVCYLRTGIVLGREGGALAKMLPAFYLFGGGPMGHGRQWMSWIHLDDMIRLILFCIDTPDLQGAINGTAPEPVSNKTFSQTLGRVMMRPALLPLPAFVLKAIFGQMADELLLNGINVIPKKLQDNGFKFDYPTLDKALADILKP